MAQPFLQDLALQVAKDLGDPRSDYTADGKTLTAAQIESGLNEAVSELYDIKLGSEDLSIERAEEFMNKFTIYRKSQTFTRIMTDPPLKLWDKPAQTVVKIKKMISVGINTTNPVITGKVAYPYTDSMYHSSLNNEYSNYKPSTDEPWFYEYDTNFSLELGGTVVISEGTLIAICLISPIYQIFGTTLPDILAPRDWRSQIIELAKAFILGDHQQ